MSDLLKSYRLLVRSIFVFFIFPLFSFAQQDTTVKQNPFNKKRFVAVSTTAISVQAISFIGLNQLWYADYPKSKFHFFNDNDEWLVLDKVGHVFNTYSIAHASYKVYRWCGVNKKKSVLYGSLMGMSYISCIEILDGYSAHWGFSPGDMIANVTGTALMATQELLWEEQRFTIKYSYRESGLAKYRPELLGKSLLEKGMKDYNAHTFWLSWNPASFMTRDSRFPKWLNIAVGYGGTGMIGGTSNPLFDDKGNALPVFKRYSEYYVSLDVDLSRIKCKSKFLRTLIHVANRVKVPFPALMYSNNKFGVDWIGF
ncbi:MAG: DUF2279 domain-containing protein [Bacteroidetes bacterium]|nr:DUF2279 domain-containing protein [Bacteroidota bacterium]